MLQFKQLIQQSIIWRGLYFISLFVVTIFLSRWLQAEATGNLFFLATVFGLFHLITNLGLEGGVTYYSSSQKIDSNQLATYSICWIILMGVISFLALPIYFSKIEKLAENEVIVQTKLGVYFIVGQLFIFQFSSLFYSKGNYKDFNLILIVLNLLFILLLIFGKQTNVKAPSIIHDYFYFIFLQGIAVALFYVVKYKTYLQIELPNNNQIIALIKFSLIGFGANFLFYFVYRFDYFFVKKWCLAIDLGNYIQASKLAQVLLIVPQILASSVFPQTASGMQKDIVENTITKWTKQLLWIYIGLFLLVALLGNNLFIVVFGESFTRMAMPILILLPGIFGLSVSVLLSAYFSGNKKNKYNLYAAMLALLTMAILTFAFQNSYSINIAAAISSLAYLVEFGFCYYVFKKIKFE